MNSPWQTFADLLDPPENPYVHDPVGWVRDRLGEFLWSKQREILEAVVHHRYVAVKSAHDTGKSHGASRAVAWWLDTRDDPFATTTAPTTKQVHAILWRYIGQAHRKGNLSGRITLDDEWYMGTGGKELVAFGRKPADHDQSAFQGIHALNPLILVDEACHDDQTEVLTEYGWRHFKELDGTERLMTMDPETHETVLMKPTRIIKKPYSGPMLQYQTTNADFCVTPDHRMLYRKRRPGKTPLYGPWQTNEIRNLKNSAYFMTRSLSWAGVEPTYHVIPELVSDRKTFPERKIIMEDWLKLLGWYLAEGNLMRQANGNACSIHIAQRKPDHRRVIKQLVERIGYSGSFSANGVTINDGQLARHLAAIGGNCLQFGVPDYVRELSPRLLNLFLDAFVLGDGYRHVNRDACTPHHPAWPEPRAGPQDGS